MAYMQLKTVLFTLALGALILARPTLANEGEKKEGEAKVAEPKPITATGRYVHTWIPMPEFSAARLGGDGDQVSLKPTKGRLMVVVFLASWCEPCQQLMPEIQRLERHYQKLNTDFIYIFSHDTREDALGFMKEFGLNNAYMANQDVLKTFHAPELPSIYLGDRHGWMLKRFLKTEAGDLAKMDGLLKYLAAY